MELIETGLAGSFLIEPETHGDERGFFSRVYSSSRLKDRGLMESVVEVYDSFSASRGTLRGMHYQLPPFAETKLVRCVKGRVYDVILDLRPASTTFGRHFGAELSEGNRLAMYAPRGFAHGFISLSADSELFYFVDEAYSPEHSRGIRWDDPRFAIEWPESPAVVSSRDQAFRDFDPAYHLEER